MKNHPKTYWSLGIYIMRSPQHLGPTGLPDLAPTVTQKTPQQQWRPMQRLKTALQVSYLIP